MRSYLGLPNIYDENSNKRKYDLIGMFIYGYMNGNLRNKSIEEISSNKMNTILREKDISVKSLPGYRNLGLRKRDLNLLLRIKNVVLN